MKKSRDKLSITPATVKFNMPPEIALEDAVASIYPIYHRSAKSPAKSELVGSSLAIMCGDVPLLVSAAHVFKYPARFSEEHGLPVIGSLEIRTHLGVREISGFSALTADDDGRDLAVISLSPETAAAIPFYLKESALDLGGRAKKVKQGDRYLVFGYQTRAEEQLSHLPGAEFPIPFRFSGARVEPTRYSEMNLDYDGHVIVNYDPTRTRMQLARRNPGSLHGISGGGIWLFDRYARENELPSLVGLVTEAYPRNHKAIVGTRFEIVWKRIFEVLGEQLRKHRDGLAPPLHHLPDV